MPGIGLRLRTLRRQWQLSLREVEQRSHLLAQERGNHAFQLSASWLDRLEREEHELTVNKLITLAEIYNVPTEQLLRLMHPEGAQPPLLKPISGPKATVLLSGGALDAQARYLLPDGYNAVQPPDETTLLSSEPGRLIGNFRRGIIGTNDLTLDPMIPAGSVVQIDTQKRAISTRKDWTHEFQRPIYFLMTRDGYVCGWCELDRVSDWLTLIPHPLSPASSRCWRYKKEIENLGRVIFVAIQLAR